MPVRPLPNLDSEYALIAYDADGTERAEDAGPLSDRLVAAAGDATDIFLLSHGWQNDLPDAVRSYDAWFDAAAQCRPDLAALAARPGGFKPLYAGLHWPSQAFGDEDLPAGPASFSVGGPDRVDKLVTLYAERLANTPTAKAALQVIVAFAAQREEPAELPDDVRAAYLALAAEVRPGNADGPEDFDPDDSYGRARHNMRSFGLFDWLRDAALTPVRQLSFWTMKSRGRTVGETGGRDLLQRLLEKNPRARLHLMGHSFGCIVWSAAVCGPDGAAPLPAPVHSLVLCQGAMSLWSYCDNIPVQPGTAGSFVRLLEDGRVAGPIVTTQSSFDRALSWWYPLGSRLGRQVAFAVSLPKYGAAGIHGLHGIPFANGVLGPADTDYSFQSGTVTNLNGDGVINQGGGVVGAHTDIAKPEVGHLLWAAALTPAGMAGPANFAAAAPMVGDGLPLAELLRAAAVVAREQRVRVRVSFTIEPD